MLISAVLQLKSLTKFCGNILGHRKWGNSQERIWASVQRKEPIPTNKGNWSKVSPPQCFSWWPLTCGELKCLYSLRHTTLNLAGKGFYLKHTPDSLKLSTSHAYYYQVQGQLEIRARLYYNFVCQTQKSIHIEWMYININFGGEMKPNLEAFFLCVTLTRVLAGQMDSLFCYYCRKGEKGDMRIVISQLVRYLRICCNYQDFVYRSKLLTTRLLRQGYVYQKLCSTYKTFVHRYPRTLQKYGRCLKNIITECIAIATV